MVEGEVGFQNQDSRILGKKQDADGKSAEKRANRLHQPPKQPKLKCPQCSSEHLYKDGMRYLSSGETVQRWLCRACGYRFSEKPPQKNQEWSINTQSGLTPIRQICVIQKEAKNLDSATEIKTVAGDLDRLPQDARGLITKFMAYLEREGYSEGIGYPATIKHLVKDGANLLDPENVKTIIARQKWKDSVKMLATYAYDASAKCKASNGTCPHTAKVKQHSTFITKKTLIY